MDEEKEAFKKKPSTQNGISFAQSDKVLLRNKSKNRISLDKRVSSSNSRSSDNFLNSPCATDDKFKAKSSFAFTGIEHEQSFKNSFNRSLRKFYVTRIKHGLVISFLLLIAIQNIFLFLISLFSETVCILFFHFHFNRFYLFLPNRIRFNWSLNRPLCWQLASFHWYWCSTWFIMKPNSKSNLSCSVYLSICL